MAKESTKELKIKVLEDKTGFHSLPATILKHPDVKKYLAKSRYRILSGDFFSPDEKEKEYTKCSSPFSGFYQLTVYDYTRNCSVFLRIKTKKAKEVEIIESSFQPEPTDEEFDEALAIVLKKYETHKRACENKSIRIYHPMPPTINIPDPDGSVQRTVTIGIQSTVEGIRSEVLAVNMINREVTHFADGAPGGSSGDPDHCGLPNAGQETTAKGTSGQSWITVTQGGKEIWKFLVIRPGASSGTKGSGIEIKYVDFKKKRVLYQGHVPILNVRYDEDKCGPFRDWQYAESMFEANGTDVAPGIRLCNTPAKTILDSNTDTGNFKGVAIYVQGQEVVLVSEMEAGWYRYISEWRFNTNGTILPRFGFAAVQNSCVCNIHHHHVYWRLDFDIETSYDNLVEEFNDPILVGNSHWHKKTFEIRRFKDASRKRKWRISNTNTGSNYEIIPGNNDGVADSFGVGDLWVLRYHGGSEIDDGVNIVFGTPAQCMAHIDNFLTGEAVDNKDVVVWYGAHFTHDVSAQVGHIVGPTLKCVKW